jgi:uncharacterized protein
MEFEWDEAKRLSNIRKHGIDFAEITAIFNVNSITVEDTRYSYGEPRYILYGVLELTVLVVVYTERGATIRIISARRAINYERKIYFDEVRD